MKYISMNEENIEKVVENYVNYYNTYEKGFWTYEKAYKRIHQVMTTEDSLCLLLYDKEKFVGFLMGYFKEYDDLNSFFLEEIVIFKEFQNQGYGSIFIKELERQVKYKGASMIELLSLNDSHHMHFYESLDFYKAENLLIMGKHFD